MRRTYPVGNPVPVLLGDEVVLDEDSQNAGNSETDGSVTGSLGDGELGGGDSDSDSSPGSDGGGTIGTDTVFSWVAKRRVRTDKYSK